MPVSKSGWPWPHFSRKELTCRCGCKDGMNPHFMRKLEVLREVFGEPMVLTSAYRCPDYNNKISRTGREGPHTDGVAVDVQVSGACAYRLIHAAIDQGFLGIGVRQHGFHNTRFIHLDMCRDAARRPRPWVWSY